MLRGKELEERLRGLGVMERMRVSFMALRRYTEICDRGRTLRKLAFQWMFSGVNIHTLLKAGERSSYLIIVDGEGALGSTASFRTIVDVHCSREGLVDLNFGGGKSRGRPWLVWG